MTPNPKRKRSARSLAAAKGRAREAMVCAILRAWGYAAATAGKEVQRLPDGRTLTRQHDLFGCIDIIATARDCVPIFVQAGRKQDMRQKERDCAKFAREHTSPDAVRVQVWGFVEGRRPAGQRFRITEWNGFEWTRCEDAVCVPRSTERAGKAP